MWFLRHLLTLRAWPQLSLSDWAQSVYSAQPGDGGPSGSHLSSLGQAPETVMRAAGANFVGKLIKKRKNHGSTHLAIALSWKRYLHSYLVDMCTLFLYRQLVVLCHTETGW